ncbi:MAG: thioredoxin domain-containing protein [Cyanobacteria bacterium J06639_1]
MSRTDSTSRADVERVRDRDLSAWLTTSTLAVLGCGAEWHGPSRMMMAAIAPLSERYPGRVQVAHLDTDVSPDATRRYDLRSIPTVLLFDRGRAVGRVVGLTSLADVCSAIERQLAAIAN